MIVKVCGMREPENIRAVERAGADWMGFIFHPDSPRYIGQRPPEYLPQRCRRVGVFVFDDDDEIRYTVETFGLHVVQLHGSQTPDDIRWLRLALPPEVAIVKMLPVASAADFEAARHFAPLVDYLLFDTRRPAPQGYYGGSGVAFDWRLLDAYTLQTPFLLAGGIGPGDAEAILAIRHPAFAGVDLNSRFERQPGLKDADALRRFIQTLKHNPATT